jgi:hypothetical protein
MTNVASKRKPILIRSSKQEGVEGGKQFAFEQRNAEQGLQADGNFTGLCHITDNDRKFAVPPKRDVDRFRIAIAKSLCQITFSGDTDSERVPALGSPLNLIGG